MSRAQHARHSLTAGMLSKAPRASDSTITSSALDVSGASLAFLVQRALVVLGLPNAGAACMYLQTGGVVVQHILVAMHMMDAGA